jgi:hypothetical protein
MKFVNNFILHNLRILSVVQLMFIAVALQSCATNPTNDNLPNQAYSTTPSIQKQSYMYRSPSGAALQSRGLAR